MANDLKKLSAALNAGDVLAAADVLFPPKAGPKIVTDYWPKPIPLRQFDWQAIVSGEDEGPIGHGRTEAEAIADLRMQLEDEEG